MSSANDARSNFIKRFLQTPSIVAMRERFEFEAVLMLETGGEIHYPTARAYALSDEMRGRVRPQANKRDDLVRWFFEFEDDAVLFALKFARCLPRPIS